MFPVDSDVKKAFIERSDEEEQVPFTDEHFAAIKSVNSSMEECLNVINSLDYIPSTERDEEEEVTEAVFRRTGVTEADNPLHEMALYFRNERRHFMETHELIPTPEEYIILLMGLLGQNRGKLAVDELSMMPILRGALSSVGITVYYYPPLSKEEQNLRRIVNPHRKSKMLPVCTVCHVHQCPNGRKLLICSHCHHTYYSSKEHQKLDWSHHKRICFQGPRLS